MFTHFLSSFPIRQFLSPAAQPDAGIPEGGVVTLLHDGLTSIWTELDLARLLEKVFNIPAPKYKGSRPETSVSDHKGSLESRTVSSMLNTNSIFGTSLRPADIER